jgi:hypothetical protein
MIASHAQFLPKAKMLQITGLLHANMPLDGFIDLAQICPIK